MTTFDNTHRRFVSYIDKSREYYLDKGYGNPYRWASNEDTPFTPLAKPLTEICIGLITTAALNEAGGTDRQVYAAPTDPAPDFLYTDHLSWHKTATHTHDIDTFLPVNRLQAFAAEGRIGCASARFYGVPTKFSQRQTNTEDAPAILGFCRADKVDAALLIAL